MKRFHVAPLAAGAALLLASAMPAFSANPSAVRAPWVSDRGDGTYRNPVLFADYSDPDVVRVGDDYWLTASSFSHVPGLPILHSRDLVNWRLVGHALPRLHPVEHFRTPRHGEGVWAPSIRHHAGKFWIFWGDPDFGIYQVTAEDPRGPWSEPVLVLAGKGLIDACPLWLDDGTAWLVHGWAKSRSGINNLLTLVPMSPDGRRTTGPGQVIIDANQLPGWRTLEGPKFYQHGGYIWIFAPAGGVAEGYQAVFRAKDIRGPYEPRIVLDQGRTPINGPHQGGWVDTPGGEHWFLHFQERQPYGRILHLQPMRWRADGWPEMGQNVDAEGLGEPVLTHRKPALPAPPIEVPATSDDFRGAAPGLPWQWQANPSPDWARVDAAAGRLHLRCVPLAEAHTHWPAAHLLLQKFPAPAFTASTTVRLMAAADGDTAGLMVFGYDYAWLGLRREGGETRLVLVTCTQAREGGREQVRASVPWPAAVGRNQPLHLRATMAEGGLVRFAWSADGETYSPIGDAFQAKESRWVGGKVGLFASAAPAAADGTGARGAPAGEGVFGPFLVTE